MIEIERQQKLANILIMTSGLLLILLTNSCGSCEDCGPQTTYAFGITNTTDEIVDFVFYFGTDSTSFTVNAFENFETTNISMWGAFGALTRPPLNILDTSLPSPHDSVKTIRSPSGLSTVYFRDECISTNPLCEESYLISECVTRSRDGDITTKKHLYTLE